MITYHNMHTMIGLTGMGHREVHSVECTLIKSAVQSYHSAGYEICTDILRMM